jgi:hypothetical protein
LALGLALCAGCSDPADEQDVVSADDVATTGAAATSQAPAQGDEEVTPSAEGSLEASAPQGERAELFYSCLMDAGVPMMIESYPADQAIVSIDTDNTYGATSDGMVWFGRMGLTDETRALVQEMFDEPEPGSDRIFAFGGGNVTEKAAVVVDGKDVTADFERCLALSHYTFPEYAVDPAEELARNQGVAEASNEWAACARENGAPTIADVTATSDENYTPTVLLPTTITPELLRALIDACPTFDKEKEDAYHEASRKGEKPDPVFRPSIGFDAPGWNGDQEAEADVDVTEGDNKRLFDLQEIILRPYSDYLESLGGVG